MIIPIGENLLLEPIPEDEIRESGIYIPDSAREYSNKGKVLDVGAGVVDEKLKQKGAIVLFRKGLGEIIDVKGTQYLILPVKEVIGILRED